jgi:triacylglycerol lipase
MTEITPALSASLANDVYDLIDLSSLRVALKRFTQIYGSIIDIDEGFLLKAKSGGPGFIKTRTAFGVCCFGKKNGAYEGHAFIVLRGTRVLADWLTNFNVGTSRSAYGQSIHDGFHRAFQSLNDQLTSFVAGFSKNKIHTVHCIGHSLGGGLATICAEEIKSKTIHRPYVYTFGAPRVGMKPFADMLSDKIGSSRIYRVYHRTDIVPCIPFWPFVHAPTLHGDTYNYFQPSKGDYPSGEWHDMNKYVTTVEPYDWETLRGQLSKKYTDSSIENWLKIKSPASLTMTNIEWLDRAINYVLVKCIKGIGTSLTMAVGGGGNLMDILSYILVKAIDISSVISSLVFLLVRKIMSIIGMQPLLDQADLSKQFIRQVFTRLSNKVNDEVRRTLSDALAKGKAI